MLELWLCVVLSISINKLLLNLVQSKGAAVCSDGILQRQEDWSLHGCKIVTDLAVHVDHTSCVCQILNSLNESTVVVLDCLESFRAAVVDSFKF
jgi:hypothetical protein